MPVGRPTDFKPEYCEKLIKWMDVGMSFESFAAEVGVSRATVHNWALNFPEFLEAKQIGQAKSLRYWEKLGLAAAAGQIQNFAASAYIFQMKNKFGWRDRVDIDVTGSVHHTHELDVSNLLQDIMKVMVKPNDGQIPIEVTGGLLQGDVSNGSETIVQGESIPHSKALVGV